MHPHTFPKVDLKIRSLSNVTYIFTHILRYLAKEVQTIWNTASSKFDGMRVVCKMTIIQRKPA